MQYQIDTSELPTGNPLFQQAVAWLAETPRYQRGPAVAELKRRYDFDAKTACAVCREVGLIRARAL